MQSCATKSPYFAGGVAHRRTLKPEQCQQLYMPFIYGFARSPLLLLLQIQTTYIIVHMQTPSAPLDPPGFMCASLAHPPSSEMLWPRSLHPPSTCVQQTRTTVPFSSPTQCLLLLGKVPWLLQSSDCGSRTCLQVIQLLPLLTVGNAALPTSSALPHCST